MYDHAHIPIYSNWGGPCFCHLKCYFYGMSLKLVVNGAMHCLHKTKNVRHNIFSNIWLKNKVRPLEDYIYCMDLLLLVSCMHYAQKEMKQPVILTELASICKCFWDCKNFFVQSKKKYTNLGVHGRKGEMDKIQSKFFLSCVGDLSKNEVVTTQQQHQLRL